MPKVAADGQSSELAGILAKSRSAFIGIAVISGVMNVLTLGGSIFMMLVYDMVLPSRSHPTLFSLLIMVTVVYLFLGIMDIIRGRMLIQIGGTVDLKLGVRIHQLIRKMALTARVAGDGLQPMRDLDSIRVFLSSQGPAALIDMPWMFFFILILFLLHPWLGITVFIGALVLIGLTYTAERRTRGATRRVTRLTSQRQAMAEVTRRHAEVIKAMGMGRRMEASWANLSAQNYAAQQELTNVAGTIGGASKVFRMLLQSVVLAVGALLVIDNKATGGVIFASSILSARALAPIEQVIVNWRGFMAARQAWARLKQLLAHAPEEPVVHELPAPKSTLSVEALSMAPPGAQRLTVMGSTFTVRAGEAVAIIGPSGSGKSTLVRGITGVWNAHQGAVRLDGAALDQWSSDALGRHIGYLPQNVELFEGSVAENIARFDTEATSEAIVAAAQQAGVHDLIVRLPEGYQTQVGSDGSALSAGQRQRIALARALYRDPFLVVLDEPNSNLDTEGEDALAQAVTDTCARGAIVLLVAHRQSILAVVDYILYMREGRSAFGPKEEILRKLQGQQARKIDRAKEGADRPASKSETESEGEG